LLFAVLRIKDNLRWTFTCESYFHGNGRYKYAKNIAQTSTRREMTSASTQKKNKKRKDYLIVYNKAKKREYCKDVVRAQK